MALRSMRPSREVSGDRFHSCSGGIYRCERIGIERVPLLASPQGGVAEQSIKCREASADCEAGVVFRLRTQRKTPPAASASVASQNFLETQPPLLAVMQGGE